MAKTGDGDFLRTIAESVLQIIMEADVDGLVGAGRHQRSGDRTTWRNGYRDRSLDTRLGTLDLKIPKLRTGAYFPGFPEPRKTVEKALVAVIQGGVDCRASAPGASMSWSRPWALTGISKSSVSKLCPQLAERKAFLMGHRPSVSTPSSSARSPRLALSLARCHLPQGARERADRQCRRDNRRRRQHRGQARDRRSPHRPHRRPSRSGPASSRTLPGAA
jgi:hypothetical protein